MGVVYLAFDPQIGRRVALKTIQPQAGARPEEIAEGRARFIREAQAAGKLLHPNIVTIFDVIEQGGELYIAMEYVEGHLLDGFCTKGRLLPVERVARLAIQGLSALAFAHRQGVVHRDIKPGNLMVVDGQTLKVMDFGVARQPGPSTTQEGTVLGTPHYMSPEQIEGKPLDGRSDLFSMGVVLYELVTGERPFPGEVISTVIYRILNESPVPPKELNPQVPSLLSKIIIKAMAKKPEERFSSALAFQEALNRFLGQSGDADVLPDPRGQHSHEGFLPPPPSAGYRPVHKRHHHLSKRTKRIMLWGTLLVVIIFIAGTFYLKNRGAGGGVVKPPPSQEELPRAVNVVTDPPGAKLFLDGTAVDAVTLAPGDQRPHQLDARLGCLAGSTIVTITGKGPQEVRLKLAPSPFRLPVSSTPPGARIIVDGVETGLTTPSQLERKSCGRFRVTLALKGWQEMIVEVDPRKDNAIEAKLATEPESGTLRVERGSAKIQIYEGPRLLGQPGQTFTLSAGEHTFRFVNAPIRGAKELKVTIKPGDRLKLDVPAFETGQVFLYGKPTEEGKVFVDGTYLEELPLNGTTPLAVGPHKFLVSSPSGKKVAFSWNVQRGGQTRVVDFQKGRVENP